MDWRFGGLKGLTCDGWIEVLVFEPGLMVARGACSVPNRVLHEVLKDANDSSLHL